jgi:hypothetical protein
MLSVTSMTIATMALRSSSSSSSHATKASQAHRRAQCWGAYHQVTGEQGAAAI